MDSLSFDSYSSYSDASTPRTPSPTEMIHYQNHLYYKGSLLNELYDQDEWQRPLDYPPIIRRATFPYVRQDRDDHYSPFIQHQQQLPLYPDPSYPQYDPTIKLEDTVPLIVQQHQHQHSSFYRSPIPMPYLPPHTNLPVQHTDDAASKETQYLRRRCFNCHTTEPPSWRRSTLNPGKIVCNKCGLYERTHLRARPLRFDEMRSGSKSRKPATSPKQSKMAAIKKEPREFGIDRRSSVSSNSSVHSVSAASDWDDNVSLYSASSAPPTSLNSPVSHNFPLSRNSLSPSQDPIAIRLPNNPLSDVASMRHPSATTCRLSQPIPHKSHTSPATYYSSPSLSEVNLVPQVQDYFPHSQNASSPQAWPEHTEMNNSALVSSPIAL